MNAPAPPTRAGLLYGLGAYLIWGFLPAFFKLLESVTAGEIVAQRIVWSLAFLAVLVLVARRWSGICAALRDRSALLLLSATAALIAVNWLVYVWAVNNGHILAASLGYFLNPLVNVAMGVLLLKERLGRIEIAAVALAAIGVAILAASAGEALWISLSLAFSFATYGLLRKIATVDALDGLAVETLILAPFALGWIVWLSSGETLAFSEEFGISLLLIAGGALTAIPLLLFAAAARRMDYSRLGLLQYLAPTIQFLLGVFAYGEPLTTAHLICFCFIWAGLAVYGYGTWRQARA